MDMDITDGLMMQRAHVQNKRGDQAAQTLGSCGAFEQGRLYVKPRHYQNVEGV